MQIQIPVGLRPFAIGALVMLVIGTIALIVVELATGHDLSDPKVTPILGYAATLITILLTALGLSNQVAAGQTGISNQVTAVHDSINGRMGQLVDATASSAWLAGQAAAPGATPPPAPSTLPQVPTDPTASVPANQQVLPTKPDGK